MARQMPCLSLQTVKEEIEGEQRGELILRFPVAL